MHHYKTSIAALVLASVLVTSLVVAGTATSSYAASKRKTTTVDIAQHVPNTDTVDIESITFYAKPVKKQKDFTVNVEILQDGQSKGTNSAEVRKAKGYASVTVEFDPPVRVTKDFDISFTGKNFVINTDRDRNNSTPGHVIERGIVDEDSDVNLEINGAGLTSIADEDSTNTPNNNNNQPPTTPVPAGTSKLTILAKNQADNKELKGMYYEIRNEAGQVASGFTSSGGPVQVNNGAYTVYAAISYGEIEFVKWEDTSSTSFAREMTVTQDKTLVAIYKGATTTDTASETPTDDTTTPPTSPPPSDTSSPPATSAGANTVTINTILLDGTPISGYQAQLRDASGTPVETKNSPAVFENLASGQQYRVVMYWFGDTFFRHWTDGGLHRYHAVNATPDGQVFTAKYERIPADQQARLTIIAKTTDGQTIGGTTGRAEDLTLSAESGMEIQVAPPGSLTPYTAFTAGFSGGSEIPFTLFKGQTYTVIAQEFGQYQFVRWEDNGSVNQARAVPMTGDITLTAIYEIVPQ